MWKAEVVVYFKVLSYLPGETRKNMKYLGMACLRDATPPEYDAGVVTAEEPLG
jgi:hypothetical protein